MSFSDFMRLQRELIFRWQATSRLPENWISRFAWRFRLRMERAHGRIRR